MLNYNGFISAVSPSFQAFEIGDQYWGWLATECEVARSACRHGVSKGSPDTGRRDKNSSFIRIRERNARAATHTYTHTLNDKHTYSTLSASVLFWSSIHVERNCVSLRWQLGFCYHDNQELNKGSVRACVCARMCLGFEIKQIQTAPQTHSSPALLEIYIHIVCQAHLNYSWELVIKIVKMESW